MRPLTLIFTLAAAALLALTACTPPRGDKPEITVSIMPQKAILDQIAGDKVEVKCLLGAGANPETYDPTVTNLMGVQNSLAYIRVGNIGFEDAIIKKIQATNPRLRIYDSGRGIEPIYGTHGHHCQHMDPHIWTSVKNMRVMARNMTQALKEMDQKNAGYYQKRYEQVDRSLDSLDQAITQRLKGKEGEEFLVWHPSLSYFARDYGLKQVTVGGAENKEASVKMLRQVVDSVRGKGQLVFFVQKDFDNIPAQAINADLGARRVEISPMAYEWKQEIEKIASSL